MLRLTSSVLDDGFDDVVGVGEVVERRQRG